MLKPMILVSAIALSGTAIADEAMVHGGQADMKSEGIMHEKGTNQLFNDIDKDGDGMLSRSEVRGTPFEANFASLDANGDGGLGLNELAKEYEQPTASGSYEKDEIAE